MHVFERGWLSSNNILLVGATNAALVDSGYSSHSQLTLSLVQGALGDRPLQTLLNTHLHSDHCGGNAALQAAFPGMRTLVPPGLADAVRRWDDVALTYQPTGQVCPRFQMDDVLLPGTAITLGMAEWEVHAAPGHDAHSVILFEPASRSLISADALWGNGFGVVFQELEGESAFEEVAETLTLIERLRPAVVVPGHGAPFSDVPAALSRARSRLDAYIANPLRHANYAAKVLLKFKLLEMQRTSHAELDAWAAATPYFHIVHSRWFEQQPFQQWISQLIGELVRSGAAYEEAGTVFNT
ncbi:MAG: MBL fold metallo-hydrolase [Proteobacteria bacterium]|nr:MAG: MBL fold metallo-hydrolase [Pseudomonadota bacterium]